MIFIDPIVFFLAVAGALIAGGLAGWNFSVHNHHATRTTLVRNIARLETQLDAFHDAERRDPQRAWIDIGKRNTLNEIENTLRAIRSTLEPEA